ncbi:MAG: hypothetical protein HYZ37_17825 [Candidatus Solibacter usitatus]|nr:hypothetical protein [Candidatus Solibacter usitatus]
MKLLLLIAITLPAVCAEVPRIFYSKSFPGSKPEYVEITVDRSGNMEYREAPKEEDPLTAKLSEAEAKQMWDLAAKLEWFRKPLESGLKVARMGDKTLRMENFEHKGETKFNYTQNEDGQLLHDWFEKISETAMHRMSIERSVRFDRLGINQAILLFESSLDRKRIVAADQFLPMLDRIAKNDGFLHMARDRAANLADTIRGASKAKSE